LGVTNYSGTKETKPCAKPGKLGQMVILCKGNCHFLQICVDLNKDCSNENKQRIFIQSLLYSKRVSHHHLGVAESKVDRVGTLHSGRKRRLQICSD